MKLAWLTDLHLNFLDPPGVEAFLRTVSGVEAEAVLLGGDIGEADDVARHLAAIDDALRRPVYLVLGNHDYYGGSIAGVRATAEALCSERPNLHYLTSAGVIPLTEQTGLVGHDGWADGRLGDYWGSTAEPTDWTAIADLDGLDPAGRLGRLHALGDEAASHFRAALPDALDRFGHVLLLTHVPPFRDACRYRGRLPSDDLLPHYACGAVGDALTEAMRSSPDRRMTVLCGHTHGGCEAQILPNLLVLTGGAVYGRPAIQRVLDVD